jgi:hypothetical protein
MLHDVVFFTPIAFLAYGIHMLIDYWSSKAPSPDGLFAGERLIKSHAAYLEIDGVGPGGSGYA